MISLVRCYDELRICDNSYYVESRIVPMLSDDAVVAMRSAQLIGSRNTQARAYLTL